MYEPAIISEFENTQNQSKLAPFTTDSKAFLLRFLEVVCERKTKNN